MASHLLTMKREPRDPLPDVEDSMSPDDLDNPQNWPLQRKIYVSVCAFAFSFTVAFGATAYTVGIQDVIAEFDVSMTAAILGLSLFFLGTVATPMMTPHLSERFGRKPVYFGTLFIFALFILGAGYARTFTALAVCRFFAGFFGGPNLILIEGTFADVWSAEVTHTFYTVLTLSSYVGVASGPLILGFIVPVEGWRWTQYVTLMLSLATLLLAAGMPESYSREIQRARARRLGIPLHLPEPDSGSTIRQQLQCTIFTPLMMYVTDPIVASISLFLGLNFAVVFAFFILVPVVLNLTYNADLQTIGLAFLSAIGGAVLSAITTTLIDTFTRPKKLQKSENTGMINPEYRLIPAMLGAPMITATLFWIGFTSKPTFVIQVPVVATGFYVWSNQTTLTALVTYFYDIYPPRGALSALTAGGCFRLLMAFFLPLVIITMVLNLTGAWALSVFGFISAALIPVPYLIFFFGQRIRARSRHCPLNMTKPFNGPMDSSVSERNASGMRT